MTCHTSAAGTATGSWPGSRATPCCPCPTTRSTVSSTPVSCLPKSVAYAIDLREPGRLVGLTTFSNLDPDNGSVLFHITIGEPDAWGQGYGTEATGLMLQLAFERIGLHRVSLSVFSFNERAIRSYQKSGFRLEGRAREAILRNGERFDELSMGILAQEWQARAEDVTP